MVKEGLINLDFADVRAVMREMGKAMMGTGEATGEKRALTAAEAAIANPLIDDVLDGRRPRAPDLDHRRQGPDAVRSRRSRDPHPRGGRQRRQHHRRRDVRRNARRRHPRVCGRDRHRCRGACRRAARPTEQKLADPSLRPPAVREAPRTSAARKRAAVPAPAPRHEVEHAALAAIAAAVAPRAAAAASSYDDVTIRAIPPKPSLFPDPRSEPAASRCARACGLHPAAAERIRPRGQRMPRFEELPITAQNEIRQARGEVADEHPQKQRLSLLQRLANVGLGRRDEDSEPPIQGRASGPAMPMPERPRQAPPPRNPERSRSACRSRYRNMPAGRPRAPRTARLIRMVATAPMARRTPTTISTFRLSCAGNRAPDAVTISCAGLFEMSRLRPGHLRFGEPANPL